MGDPAGDQAKRLILTGSGMLWHLENLVPGVVLLGALSQTKSMLNIPLGLGPVADTTMFLSLAYVAGMFSIGVGRIAFDRLCWRVLHPAAFSLLGRDTWFGENGEKLTWLEMIRRSADVEAFYDEVRKHAEETDAYRLQQVADRRRRGRLIRSCILPVALLGWVSFSPLAGVILGFFGAVLFAYSELAIFEEAWAAWPEKQIRLGALVVKTNEDATESASSDDVVYEDSRLQVRLLPQSEDGTDERRAVVSHPPVTVTLPIMEDGSVVFIRNRRHAVSETLWELPAGRQQARETAEACGRRELKEETGYTADRFDMMGTFFAAPSWSTYELAAFVATGLEPGDQILEQDEDIEVRTVRPGEVTHMIKAGLIRDAKTLSALALHAARSGPWGA